MYSLNQVNKLVSCGRDPARSLPFWRGFLLIPLILVCFAFAPQTQAVTPPPDGGYPNNTTAEGTNALFSLTTGINNTGIGFNAARDVTTGNYNTVLGAAALRLNTGSNSNTAVGNGALFQNTANRNTAVGTNALTSNGPEGTGSNAKFNDAVGVNSLFMNSLGFSNNAFGDSALFSNVSGAENTAIGDAALGINDSTGNGLANYNTAVGAEALTNNVDGPQNTVVGTGAGPNVQNGSSNTYLGQFVGDNNGSPIPDEDLTIRIADFSADGFGSAECYIGGIWNNPQPVGGTVVVVTLDTANDHLGYDATLARGSSVPSLPHRSAPVPRRAPGAPAERPAMLHDTIGKVEKLEATVAQQQKQIETLTAQLREQSAQIQKVSAQVEMIKPAPRVVENR